MADPRKITKRWLSLKKDPIGTLLAFMREIDDSVATTIGHKADTAIAAARSTWENAYIVLYQATKKKLDDMAVSFDSFLVKLQTEARRKVDEKIASMPAIKGDAGYTPVKGKDYFDGQTPVKGVDYFDGETPQADVHYLSLETTRREIGDGLSSMFHLIQTKGLPKKQAYALAKALVENMPVELLVRRMEKLPYADKLDYFKGLKNAPGVDVSGHQENQRHYLHRGGTSKQTYEQDLSDLCDGNTRTFPIPVNTRIVLVQCTDAPAGILRKGVDYTGSGTMELVLSNDIAAPTAGATLSVLYVV